MYSDAAIRETLVLQRDRARYERDQYLSIIRKLVILEDAPRSAHYHRAWSHAMETAREVVRG
jgi:hypothetical protein